MGHFFKKAGPFLLLWGKGSLSVRRILVRFPKIFVELQDIFNVVYYEWFRKFFSYSPIKKTACRKDSIIKYLTVFPSICLLQGSNLGNFKLWHCFSKLQNLYKFLYLPLLLHYYKEIERVGFENMRNGIACHSSCFPSLFIYLYV